MSLILDNHLLDLGPAGLLAITTESDHAPVLAHEACDAAWVDADGQIHDRRELFAIEIDAHALRAGVEETASRMRNAVASVLGQVRWLSERAKADQLRLFPCEVVAVAAGRVLAIYSAPGVEPRIRYLDVIAAKELWALSETELRQAWNVPAPEAYLRNLLSSMSSRPRVTANGRHEVCVAVDMHSFLLRPEQSRTSATRRDKKRAQSDLCYAGPWRIERNGDHESAEFSATHVGDAATARKLSSTLPGWILKPCGALDSDVVALPHAGGTIAIQSLSGSNQVLRPHPKLARDAQTHVEFERHGRYFIANAGYATAVADREQLRCAPVNIYPHIDQQLDRDRFDAKVLFRAAMCLRDCELILFRDDQLIRYPLEKFQWQSMPDASVQTKQTAAAKPQRKGDDAVERLAASLRLPRVNVEFSKPQASTTTSVLGDHGLLPEALLPEHEGVPMAMLCQIDLASVAAAFGDACPYPRAGALLVFVSVDEDGELAEADELGSPAALVVMLLDGEVPPVEVRTRRSDQNGPRALSFAPLRWMVPDVDSIHVDPVLTDPEAIERYREIRATHGEAAENPPIRIGGYPLPLQSNDLEVEAARLAELQFDRETSPHEWRLLLQFESDDFMWGTDSGCLYVMIHLHDLAAGDFSRVVWIAQGY